MSNQASGRKTHPVGCTGDTASAEGSKPVAIGGIRPREYPLSALSPQEMAAAQLQRKQKEYTLVVAGCTGRGKSTFCNFLSKSDKFKSGAPGSAMGSDELAIGEWGEVAADTTETQFEKVEDLVTGVTLNIIDLPGYLATQNQTGTRQDLEEDGRMVLNAFAKALKYAKDGIDAVFVALKSAERISTEERLLMEFISVLQLWDHCVLLFTHGDRVGKKDNERYDKLHKLINAPNFRDRCPVLHEMVQDVHKRFVIVESVNDKDVPDYYDSKVSELCGAIEVVRMRTGTMIKHPLLDLARKAFDMSHEMLDLKRRLDEERDGRSSIQAELEQLQRERRKKDQDCKMLQAELEREKEETQEMGKVQKQLDKAHRERNERDEECRRLQAELERKKEQTQEMGKIQKQLDAAHIERDERDEECRRLQAELERERDAKTEIGHRLQEEENVRTQFVRQRTDLRNALQQRQVLHGHAEQLLMHWLREPQEGPDEVVDMLAELLRRRPTCCTVL